ncbi:MAG: hypothetical protein FAF05_04685 [Epsilonproteobacteria bacterium]|nr:hypothetical protein [Campylobacterota bacterium]
MRIFLLIFIIFTSLYAKKGNYSVIIHQPFDAALFDITENYDRTISAIGFSNQNKQSSNPAQSYSSAFDYLDSIAATHGTQIHILKVDNAAKILLSKAAKLSRFNKGIALVKTPDNGYFVGGYTLDGELLLAKLSANGNVVYATTFGTKNYDRLNNLVPLSDGGVLAVGFSFTSRDTRDDMFTSGLGVSDIFLTRFSKNGQLLWSKKYGTKYDDEGIDAAEAPDGSIVVVSTISYEKNKDVTLMRITENGNRIWLKKYSSKNLIVPKKIIRLKDGNFLLSLVEYNALQQEHIRLIKFDLYKNLLIDRNIFTTYPSGLNDIKEFSDGSIMGVGYVKDTFNTDGLAMLLDSNLAMLRQEHYGDDNYDNFHALAILHNSQVAVAGEHTDKHSQETNMWIVKLNKDATMAQISLSSQSFYEKLCNLFAIEIKNHQLNIKKDITIELIDPKLYFEVGVYKLTPYQKEFLETFTKKLVPFLYKHKELVKTFAINGHTSSEWDHQNFTDSYLNNEQLSMKHSYSVFEKMFRSLDLQNQKWFSKVVVGSAYSSSKKQSFNDSTEDKKRSRRVNFQLLLY